MGLRGPIEDGAILEVADSEVRPVPAPPPDLRPDLYQEWQDYWTSPLSNVAHDTDVSSLRRLFTYRDEWFRLALAYAALSEEDRVVDGSRNSGALRTHPFGDRMLKLEGEITKLEDKFGLNPLARARLGIELGTAKKTWAELSQMASGEQQQSTPTALPVAGVVNQKETK